MSSRSPTKHKNKKEISNRDRSISPPKRQPSARLILSDTSSDSGILSPAAEYKLTQDRLREYSRRQAGLAEKNRRRIADAIALATKYLRKPLNIPDVTFKDFLRACETEANTRRRKTCQRSSYFVKNPEYCQKDEACAQCELNQIKEGFNRGTPGSRFKCPHHCQCEPNMTATVLEKKEPTSTPVSFCRKVELQNRGHSPGGHISTSPVPGPVVSPTPRRISTNSPEARLSTAVGYTPDSEYDTGKRNELIDRFITKPKMMHYECRPRTRMFMFTDKSRSCNIVHNPYAAYRGKKVITVGGKKKEGFLQKSSFKVPGIGVSYKIPDINPNLGHRHTPFPTIQPTIHWNKTAVLPPIKGQQVPK